MYEPKSSHWTGETRDSDVSPVRMLLAEDTPISAEMMLAMANHLSVEMDVASNGLEAIDMVDKAIERDKPYSLLLTDVMMPILDGVETTKRLRKKGISAKRLPIIAVTAATAMDDIRTYRAAGMQAFLEKPVSLDDLRATLVAWGHRPKKRKPKIPPEMLDALRQQFDERTAETLSKIEAILAEGSVDPDSTEEIKNLLHQIAGTAATFGDPDLSEAAREHENALIAASLAPDNLRNALEGAASSLRERKNS